MKGVEEFIDNNLGYNQYSFTWEELNVFSQKTEAALKNELSRLCRKGELLNLRHGFYLIFSPKYRNYGKIPVELYADKLFHYLKKPYYIALYSAASYFGASHQQIQKDYLITQVPAMRNVKKKNICLDITVRSNWPDNNILQKRSEAGYFNISSPALTIADMLHYQNKLGTINRMLAVLEELQEELTVKDLKNLLTWYPYNAVKQRMGFLLQELGSDDDILEVLLDHLNKQNRIVPVLLNIGDNKKTGNINYPWKVDVNIELESDI